MSFSGKVVEALKSIPEKEWMDLFDALIFEKLLQLEGRPQTELAALQAEVKSLRILQHDFVANRQR